MDRGAWIALVLFALLAACSGPEPEGEASASAVAVAGRWRLPESVAAAGAMVRLRYDAAPPWTGTGACSGKLRTGARKLGAYLAARFDQISSVGGYACRPNTADDARTSVHGTGRAIDVFIPPVGAQADNGKGDKVANWLVLHAAEIGVQLVIWDRSVWRGNGTNEGPYGGPSPHADHIHVELTQAAGAAKTPWFATLDGAGDDDGGANADAGPAPPLDAGYGDADAHADAGPKAPDAAVVATPQDDAGDGWESPEAEDGPGDRDSVTRAQPHQSPGSPPSGDVEAAPSSGCSAAPARASAGGAALLLAAAAVVLRRRRDRHVAEDDALAARRNRRVSVSRHV